MAGRISLSLQKAIEVMTKCRVLAMDDIHPGVSTTGYDKDRLSYLTICVSKLYSTLRGNKDVVLMLSPRSGCRIDVYLLPLSWTPLDAVLGAVCSPRGFGSFFYNTLVQINRVNLVLRQMRRKWLLDSLKTHFSSPSTRLLPLNLNLLFRFKHAAVGM